VLRDMPHPLNESEHIRHTTLPEPDDAAQLTELADSGLMDARWYRARYPDIAAAGIDPIIHFHRYGATEGRWPNRYFDTSWYAAQNPDVVPSGLNPVIHYHRHGDREGRRPHPFMDPAWYRRAHDLSAGTKALAHFLTVRKTGRYAPCVELWCLQRRSREGRGDVFAAYLDRMHRRGQDPFPDLPIVRASGLVDPNYYLINAEDVHAANVDPVEHYCRFGWREGRRPNIYFDPDWYVRTNPDLARLRVNPIVHYLLVGEPGDRRPVPYFEPTWYRQAHGVPPGQTALGHFLAQRRTQSVSPNHLFDVVWYATNHADVLGPHRDPFAHYLQDGTFKDIDPSPSFSAAEYRRRHMGRPSRGFRRLMTPDRDNPLVHCLRVAYQVQAAP